MNWWKYSVACGNIIIVVGMLVGLVGLYLSPGWIWFFIIGPCTVGLLEMFGVFDRLRK
jgi:hypothetical protein